jgi:DNA polymerase-1
VKDSADTLRRNLKLTTLNLSLPVVEAKKPLMQVDELLRLLAEMEMKTTLVEAQKRYTQAELF